MDEKTVKAIEFILAKGDRAELIPVKDGVKVIRVKREEVKEKTSFAKKNNEIICGS